MSTQIKTGVESQQSLIQIIKEKLDWKKCLLILIPVFIIYPRPFLYLMNPFIQRINSTIKKDRPRLEKIIFSINRNMNADKICKSKLYGNAQNIYTINAFEQHGIQEERIQRSSSGLQRSVSWQKALNSQPNLYIQADNVLLRIRMQILQSREQRSKNYAILIKGNPELLRLVQAKIYEMDPMQYYKIPMFHDQEQLHILQSLGEGESYEQTTTKIKG